MIRSGGRIIWINQADLDRWGIGRDELEERAAENLNAEIARATLHLNEAQGTRFLMIGSCLAFKASLLLASTLRDKVEPEIGWPIYAIAPSRDFLWMWGEKDHPRFTNLLGSVVKREFLEAPYPVTPEVFCISDEGISAIGAFETGNEIGSRSDPSQ